MRLSTIALSFIALGVATVAASSEQQDNTPVVRDFERKLQVRDPRKHDKKRTSSAMSGVELTWYGGGQLDNPACGGSTPSKTEHVVAVKEGGMFKCHDTIHITHGSKTMKAKVVDYCGGCDEKHIDMTQGLFQEFSSLSTGVLSGAHVKIV